MQHGSMGYTCQSEKEIRGRGEECVGVCDVTSDMEKVSRGLVSFQRGLGGCGVEPKVPNCTRS